FLIAVPTVGAYALVQLSLKRAESTLVAAYIYLQPVFVTFGAMARLHEHPSSRVLLAAPVVFIGVFLASQAPVRKIVPDEDPSLAAPRTIR
ncbi:MAG: DMT family transporter, partial [Kofleriaceae bacterium]|nr:DMT family transporter [Kofleriaceae bacterium]